MIYSRVGDRNTSSAECATKQATEFLWKKRFGLVGSDEIKVVNRLKNADSWYSTDEYDTFYNREYGDITIQRDNKMFPDYAKAVDTSIVYKLGKTLVEWLYKWRWQLH